MVNNSTHGNICFTWQAMIWRLALTGLLLLMLAGSGLTIFKNVTTHPDTQVLPTVIHTAK